jgi:hypothetical protein
VERAVAGDAGIIDQDLHRAEVGFNPGDACLTGVEIGYIDLVDGDTGRFFEFIGCLVVTAIDGRQPLYPLSFSCSETIPPIPRVPPVTIATLDISLSCFSSSAASILVSGVIPAGFLGAHSPAGSCREYTPIASVALYAHGDAHAAADAERGEAFLGVPLLHFV